MPARTRANSSTTSAPANLAAAPRRRVKVTPLDKDDTKSARPEVPTRLATRATRNRSLATDTTLEQTSTATKPVASKARGRPKKAETTAGKETVSSTDGLAEKPKRVTRSTRATATTVSSEAKEKPAAKTTRAAKSSARATRSTDRQTESESKVQGESAEIEPAQPSRAPAKKRVTFQDIERDKENQPVTRAAKNPASSKSVKSIPTFASLKSKPVRKPAVSTRSSKRTKDVTSDDEGDQKPKKIQRVLTPKKITQVIRPLTPDESSEDELNGGKTPVRDLSVSPRRPQNTTTLEAVTKTLSPSRNPTLAQPHLQQSARKNPSTEMSGALASPARRLAASPAKIFSQSILGSAPRIFRDSANPHLASPARRPVMSTVEEGGEPLSGPLFGDASKLLFPNAHKTAKQSGLAQGSNGLLQSPRRPTAFGPAHRFGHSAVKPQSTNLSRSSFLSSPARRIGGCSPLKKTPTVNDCGRHGLQQAQSPELDLNEMEVTNLVNDEILEITASSHQRASISPLRTYKLSEDELQVDFDDSILAIRSPLKVAKSPIKSLVSQQTGFLIPHTTPHTPREDEGVDTTEVLRSARSTPRSNYSNKNFVSFQVMDAEGGSKLKDTQPDLVLDDATDDSIMMSEVAAEGTPCRFNITQADVDMSLDELAPSPQEDMMAKYIRTPGTPATIHEHEPTNMPSPAAESKSSPTLLREGELTNILSTPYLEKPVPSDVSPVSLHEHELTGLGLVSNDDNNTPSSSSVEDELTEMPSSPALVEEHELSRMGSSLEAPKNASNDSPVSIHEHELTTMLVSPKPRTKIVANASPASLHEHELTNMMSPAHTTAIGSSSSPVSIHEHELTNMMESTRTVADDRQSSPISIHEHELTNMISSPPQPKAVTPHLPVVRKFNLNTVVTKIPLKPEGQESPFKLNIKKRKRPLSLGGQPEFMDVIERTSKSPRTSASPEAAVPHSTPASHTTPAAAPAPVQSASRASTVKTSRRVVSTPNPARTPLAPVANGVLSGSVIYVDVRTSEGADASAIYIELLTGLGAKVVSSITDASLLTHIVYKDGNPKTLDKIRRASMGDGVDVRVVGVSWVLDCDAKKEWLDEGDYLVNLTATDHVVRSVSRSARRKSMQPSMLISDGTGSVKRSKSRNRASMRRSNIKPLGDEAARSLDFGAGLGMATPVANPSKKQADLEKNSLTAAWKSINAPQNLGEDTPARRTLELLQKSYALEQENWDSTILSAGDDDDDDDDDDNDAASDENTPRPTRVQVDDDRSLLETGLTPAPYSKKLDTIGSAPAKARHAQPMSYRERVEEMERRQVRENAVGVVGGQAMRARGKRVTMFGEDFGRL